MQEPTYAGFWIRLMAVLIDTVILVALVLPLLVMFAPLPSGHPWAEDVTVLLVQSGLQTIAFTVLTLLFWKLKSATPGKLLLKQQIIDVNTGGKASTSQLLIRYIGY
ncbi:MAG: RDD family protein, partial [Burkholderiaceae bacterium]